MTDPFEFAIELALEAGSLLQKFFISSGLQAAYKADHSVVTKADLAADQWFSQEIRKHFPEDAIISEESIPQNVHTGSSTWIIDPLDGTTNFSLGLPIWGVSIARITDGYPHLGVLHFPMINELYTTTSGQGAFLNRLPILAREPDPTQPMSFFTCCSRTFRDYHVSVPYKPRIMGSAAYSFCMVARGAALLGFDATPKIWDLAAVWLLVKEAGGIIAAFEDLEPFPLSTASDPASTCYPTLAASTQKVFEFGKRNILGK